VNGPIGREQWLTLLRDDGGIAAKLDAQCWVR
jgi:hypothetical protein